MLADVREYLRGRERASLRDLALHFDMAPDAMRELLGVWLRKGRVRRVDIAPADGCGSACGGGCSGCGPGGADTEVYAWAAPGPREPSPPERRP